jgi:DNA-binding CsgD family transcriptional regulator/predicted negative regulator of RcsB-dependent stress response
LSTRDLVDEWNRQAEQLVRKDPAHAMDLGRRALATARQARYTAGMGQAHFVIAFAANMQGNALETLENFREALACGRRAKLRSLTLRSLMGVAVAQQMVGDLQSALETFNQYFDSLDATDPPAQLAMGLNNAAQSLLHLGRNEEALAYYRRALAVPDLSRDQQASLLGNVALVYGRLGRLADAQRAVEDLARLSDATGADTSLALAWANLGEAFMLAGQLDKAEECLARSAVLTAVIGDCAAERVAALNVGEVRLRQGRMQEAAAQASAVLAQAERLGYWHTVRDALDLSARVAAADRRWEDAYGLLNRRVEVDNRITREKLDVLTHYSADKLRVRTGNLLAESTQPAVQEESSRAPLAGSPTAPRRPSHQEPLSPQQQRVLHLLVQGQSNKQIASSLHLSPATVRQHVSEVLARLGARTRVEAAAMAAAGFLHSTPHAG